MRRIAIIPARGGSKRLPRKNILELGGQPMLSYPIARAKESGLFDRIIVSTEDDEIAGLAKSSGAEVMDRSDELAGDQKQVIDVCHDVLRRLIEQGESVDLFCCIYATAVFLKPEDFIESEKIIHEKNADIVMGVSGYPIHPYKAMEEVDGFLRPAFPEMAKKQSQNYPDFYASNGTIYWARADYFMKTPSFFADRLSGYVIPNERAPDIDEPEDYEQAQLLADLMFKDGGQAR